MTTSQEGGPPGCQPISPLSDFSSQPVYVVPRVKLQTPCPGPHGLT